MSDVEPSQCFICEDARAEFRAVVEIPGVHHATNTLVCADCRSHERCLRADASQGGTSR